MRAASLSLVIAVLVAACGRAPQVAMHPADAPPARLSEWRVVLADGRNFAFNAGVVAYDLNTPLFSDYALKLRSVWIPTGTVIRYSTDREFEFPIGTIISKTFHYRRTDAAAMPGDVLRTDREVQLDRHGRLDLGDYLLVETRLLVRYESGWRALPYVWNSAQDEAFLELAGDVRDIRLHDVDGIEQIVYVVPDANQCSGCHMPDHTAAEMRPLGPRAWQLNRDYGYGGTTRNQLDYWLEQGLLTGGSGPPPPGVHWSDPGSGDLEARAKAYLDANCAHCHNPRGAADTSALDLSAATPVDRRYGVCKPPVAVGRGSGDRPYDIYPGRPDDSILVYRMQHSDPAIAMPELGRSTVHDEGVALIRDWIATLPGDC